MNTFRYWIVGAGGLGREVLSYFNLLHRDSPQISIFGFIDDDLNKPLPEGLAVSVKARIKDFRPQENDRLFLAIGNPQIKKDIFLTLKSRNAHFASLIHPTATVGPRISLGEGCVICPNVAMTCDITIGDAVLVNCNSTLGHDVAVGSFTTISGHCDLTGGVQVGKVAFLASHASISPGKIIGDHAHVGPGSSVIQNVRTNQKVFGVPALPFKG